MIDPFNRDINYLRVSITDRCNLRCIYCMPKEGLSLLGHDDILRYEEILRVVRETVKMGISKVRITGGEPLARRGIIEFIHSLMAIEGLEDISLTTNGILLEKFAEQLASVGMKRINISLDSLNSERYSSITRGGNLDIVLRGIDAVQKLGLSPIKINVVVVDGLNDDEIGDFARMSIEKPYQIRFIELMPMGRAPIHNFGKYLSNDIIKKRIRKHHILAPVEKKRRKIDGPAQLYRIDEGIGEIGFISPVSHDFCITCNRLRLTAEGHLRTCLLADEETDLKGALRSGCTDEELRDLIRTAIAKKPLKHGALQETVAARKCTKGMSAIGG
jgi:GTP 3',8-cyclase